MMPTATLRLRSPAKCAGQMAGMTCRVEGGKTYNQVYNVENRLATVQQLSQGNCPASNVLATANIAASWNFIYDGDGNRVRQEYFEGAFGQDVSVKVTSYYAGGSYELDQSGVVPRKNTGTSRWVGASWYRRLRA